ncbi:MAG: sigma-70 family RNA polymerase sigma factor [Deltaproteobacteria bacterium]
MSLPVLSDSLNNYLVAISRYHILSAEEEERIAKRYYSTKSLEDAHKLVTSNLRYVVKIALEYRHYGTRLADLIQEGNIGLMVAVKKFNPYKGFRLITYATWWIRSHIQDFILKTSNLVKRNTRALKKMLFYKKDNNKDSLEGNIVATGLSRELSLDAPISAHLSGKPDNTAFIDMLSDTEADPALFVAQKEALAIAGVELNNALLVLNKNERTVVEKRFLEDPALSLQEIGDMLGVSRERVRQIEERAKQKLKDALTPAMTVGSAF